MTIHSKASTAASREGYDRIWGDKNKTVEETPVEVAQIDAKRERLYNELKRCVKDWLGNEAVANIESATFDELGADSLDQIEMLMDIEETFELEISDDTAQQFKTVNNVLDYLMVHVAS